MPAYRPERSLTSGEPVEIGQREDRGVPVVQLGLDIGEERRTVTRASSRLAVPACRAAVGQRPAGLVEHDRVVQREVAADGAILEDHRQRFGQPTFLWCHALPLSRPCSPIGSARPASKRFVDLTEFQGRMAQTFGQRDRARGLAASVAWLTEEVGELAQAVRKGDDEQRLHELADVLAWLASIAEQLGLSLDEAARRYADGCPRCGAVPCACPF